MAVGVAVGGFGVNVAGIGVDVEATDKAVDMGVTVGCALHATNNTTSKHTPTIRCTNVWFLISKFLSAQDDKLFNWYLHNLTTFQLH